ncbi:glycoside hydrolase family 38 C-terminal domain-containing protein [Companilactobacillus sp. HBUAS56275]|uniref:Alpha-mannosidase n=1 Tax=Candidatus Companilactobacillus pullicola TaxID=2838523 RepID=A0A9D1ZLV5_9LACO|nr:alpha-mannosidase [Candidatus Companilactobacillus pullicola]
MKKVFVIAHTHWDFEWYFTRQDARIQFIYHMDEVLRALKNNVIDYYLLDGQMSIIDDYLESVPENASELRKFIKAGRLFVGPWYTQVDEMVTSGESMVRNLQQGIKLSSELGRSIPIGYLPDSFGQNHDIPKIYNGFGIKNAVFWRGMPKEKSARYFYWTSDDNSRVLVANLRNGYPVGVDLMESSNYPDLLHKISTNTDVNNLVLPVGGDQRPVDFNLKQKIKEVNTSQSDFELVEGTYPEYFKELSKEKGLPTYSGEFVDPSTSKIHRGIYSSRADLKMLYDRLERLMTFEVEPLMAMAQFHGIMTKPGVISQIWKTIFRGQAHDSSGGCNSDETNRDIHHRGEIALQLGLSLKGYLLRKLSSNVTNKMDLFFWNPTVSPITKIYKTYVITKSPKFELIDEEGNEVEYQVIKQDKIDKAILRHDKEEMVPDYYYKTTVAVALTIQSTDWTGILVKENIDSKNVESKGSHEIENDHYQISMNHSGLTLVDKDSGKIYHDFLTVEDGGDEGDTYDYSPAYRDWILSLNFNDSEIKGIEGKLYSSLSIKGNWLLPVDLEERGKKEKSKKLEYNLQLTLEKNNPVIGVTLKLSNNVLDHRLRLVINTGINAKNSYADTPFGVISRPVIDPHLKDWKEIGYHEEPTSIRPFLHFANIHNSESSVSFIGLGEKDFQVVGDSFNSLAVTLFRGVGFLGRPDLLRRPSDASGLQTKYVPTPDSQLQGDMVFEGGILISKKFDPSKLQRAHNLLSVDDLFYQNQDIDKFTMRVQYFGINKNIEPLIHKPLVNIKADDLVKSTFTSTPDGTGLVVRLYNPSKEKIKNPGSIRLNLSSNVKILNLNNQVIENGVDNIKEYELASFNPGEIRTFGIYPIK